MAEDDRGRWNAKHHTRGLGRGEPSAALVELARFPPRRGRALNVAGGTGAAARWLWGRGLRVELVDISDEALRLAAEQDRWVGGGLVLHRADLEVDPLPPGRSRWCCAAATCSAT